MKDVGIKLKQAREAMEISIDEAAQDLNLMVEEIDNLEKGDIKFFDNVPKIKELIEIYGKYLGLHYELLVDDFNEYLFDYTSKISLQAIKKAEKKEEDNSKPKSPYTIEQKGMSKMKKIICLLFLVGCLIMIYYYFK